MSDAQATASGAYATVAEMVARQRCVILDGATATEIGPAGAGGIDERLWGTRALLDDPDAVLAVHRRYVEAGCDVLSTNTWGLPSALGEDGPRLWESTRPVHWMDVARRGVALARRAVAEGGREGEVAVAFSLNGDIDSAEGAETVRLLMRAFDEGAPDLFLIETLSLLRPSLFDVVERLVATGLPVWLSFRRCRHGLCGVYGEHWGGPEGDAFGRAARRFEDMGVAALLVNCIPPDHVDGIVGYLRDFTDLPLGVYPNLGYYTAAGWSSEEAVDGERYAQLALRWRAEGAQIVGGCCGTRPEHIAAARAALAGTLPGAERRQPHDDAPAVEDDADEVADRPWTDRRRRRVWPLAFPEIVRHPAVPAPIAGTHMTWKYLFEEGVGAHQRCLDVGSGTGLQTVQLALNGAAHVHALDVDRDAVANTLDNAFRNGVAERVTAEAADLYPWIPPERYEVVVATLPQTPADPAGQLSSHRPVDYWGRGLFDQLLAKLPQALAPEGTALVAMTSALSRRRTVALLGAMGMTAQVVAWDLAELTEAQRAERAQMRRVEDLSDAYHLGVGDRDALVVYLLEIRHRSAAADASAPPWEARA